MEVVFALLMVAMVVIAIRGFFKVQDDNKRFKARVQRMSENELKTELYNLHYRVRNMPGVVRKNSDDGVLLTKVKSQANIVHSELERRGLQ